MLLIETAMALKESECRQIEQQTELLLAETGATRNSGDFYDILQKQSLKLQKRAADIVSCLQVDQTPVQPDLFNALQHFQRRDGQIEKNAPQGFLSKQEKDFLNLGGDKFPISLYKVLLFQQLSAAIKSETVNFSDSHKYRSLDDYLISREFWQQHRDAITRTSRFTGVRQLSGDFNKFVGQSAPGFSGSQSITQKQSQPALEIHRRPRLGDLDSER